MLNAMVQASEIMVLSMGYEVTYNCFFQEQMKTLHQATVYESRLLTNPMSSCFIMLSPMQKPYDYFNANDKFDEFVEDHHERQTRNCHAKRLHQLRRVQF